MTVAAHAKINWTLEVLGVRSDGYHEIRSIVLPIPLHDTVTLDVAPEITCCMNDPDGHLPDVPPEENLAYRAAVALKEFTGCAHGVRIAIEKRIPIGSGLGGGSADAAAVLNGLNELWGVNLSTKQLGEIAIGIGSDVPALVLGGPVLMEGRGDKVRPYAEQGDLPDLERIVVFTPGLFSSTSAVYREFRDSDCGCCRNDLQPAAIRLYPGIGDAIRHLEGQGLQRVTMSGSGSAVYGLRP